MNSLLSNFKMLFNVNARNVFVYLFLFFSLDAFGQTGGEIAVFPHIQKQLFTDWGYDIKQPGKAAALTNTIINRVFVEDGMTVLRVPIYANDGHPSEGVVTDSTYTVVNEIIGAINRVKAIKPSVKIFASLRLEGDTTYPDWVKDGSGKVDSSQLSKLYRDYLVYMKGKGITVDIFGVDNESEYNLGGITPAKYKNIVARIKGYAATGLYTVPSQFVAAENYLPSNGTTFINQLNNNGWRNTMDIGGTHYYPHLRTLFGITNFCNAVGSKPIWNTEIHWDNVATVDNQLEAEEALIALFDCFDLGMTGMTWWAYGTGLNDYRSQLNRALVQSAVNSRPIDVDDVDGRQMVEATTMNTRAFRQGNTINIWITNYRNTVLNQQVVKLMSGTISGTPVYKQWINGALVSGTVNAVVTSPTTLNINIPASTFTLLTIQINDVPPGAFAPNNLLVVRSGYSTNPLSSNANAVILDEYTTQGNFVQSRQISTNELLLAGSSVVEGYSQLSQNQQYLAIAGYDSKINEIDVASTPAALVNRAIAIVNANGSIEYGTQNNTAFDQGTICGAVVSNDGTKIWASGNGDATSGGLYFITKGTSNAVKVNGTNLRVPAIFNNQLYISSNSGSLGNAVRIGTVGTGLPEVASNATNFAGADFSITAANGGVPVSTYQYALINIGSLSPNILYIANDASTLPGIKKYVLESGVWNYKFTIGNGTSVYRGLTAMRVGNNVELYATADGNKVMKAVDINALNNNSVVPTANAIITAPNATVYKGISFTPGSNTLLPLSFVSINATLLNTQSTVIWKTANEINVRHFEIERSYDGISFSKIGTLDANNTNSASYVFKDSQPQFNNTCFYRIKAVDNDGTFTYSSVATISVSATVSVSLFPNPASNVLMVTHNSAVSNSTLLICDMYGKRLINQNLQIGTTKTLVNLSQLAKGTYVLRYYNNNVEENKIFTKQ